MHNNNSTIAIQGQQAAAAAEETITMARQLLDIFSQVISECPNCRVKSGQLAMKNKNSEVLIEVKAC